MKRYLGSTLLFISIICIPGQLFAQETPATVSTATSTGTTSDGAGLQSCFDYYRFGSVPVVLASDTLRIAQGADLKLTGSVTNENAYPIDNATVYAKVFYKKNFEKNSFGPDVVDWFVLADNVNLKAKQSLPLSYTWKVPANAQPGYYQVATYVASHDRFNLAGLTFSNDIVGNIFNFSIAGQDVGSVRFDNTRTMVNGAGFHAAIFPPRTKTATDGVPIVATIGNTTDAAYSGTVHWTLYSWDAINKENLLAESDSKVSVGAHASTTVTYTVKDIDHTVYYIIGEMSPAQKGAEKSLLTIRYVSTSKESLDRPRIAFIGATAYPSVAGDTKVFACFHSTGSKPSGDVRVELTSRPLDPLSWLLHFGSLGSNTYTGSAPGEIAALSAVAKANSRDFSVTASLYQDGRLLDRVTTTYSCSMFSDSCPLSGWVIMTIVGAVLAIIAIIMLIAVRRRHRHVPPPAAASIPVVN